ncbi:MAG: dihydroorotate dehydrogenase electron transfer subunit [Clostridia bacterium]|nr:dihydroorotate dehydrogenase electron transfer subunit [Clostridia bacterium]
MPIHSKCKLVKKEQLKEDIFKFSVEAGEIAKGAKPGQFLEIRVTEEIEPLLRRPISIYNVEGNIVEFIFQIKGKGTEILSKRKEGEEVDILGPLGQGTFKFEGKKNIAIIGGGIGTFPLYELAKEAKKQAKINMYLGFRNKDFVVLEEEFKKVSDKLILTTDDGSYGEKGFAINFLKEDIEKEEIDGIYACGPLPMLKAVQALAKETKIPCQISLEERMGCGIGVCLGCAVKVNAGEETVYTHVCKAGPVFDSNVVEI